MPPLLSMLLFIGEQITFFTGAFLMYRIYKRYGFQSHGYMALSFSLWTLSSLSRLVANFFDESQMSIVQFVWQLMNFFLILGIITTFYSFFYYQYNRLPARANVSSIIGGATILAYCNPEWFLIARDTETGTFNATYSPVVSLFAVPLIVLFTVVFMLPIITKYRFAKSKEGKREALKLLIVLSFLLSWAAMSVVTTIAIIRWIRPFLFVAGWAVWIYITSRRPLTLIFTYRKFDKLLVMSTAGYPILLYDFDKGELEDPALFSALFSALQSAMSNLLRTDTNLRSVNYENKVVIIEAKSGINFLGIGDKPDVALETALRVFADSLLQYYQLVVDSDGALVTAEIEENDVKNLIAQSFHRVIL